ncbi:hypothetical protein VNI00_004520 [Paramarasmius palmivorus]|uniref:Uncharacterized protein n=1 Tax=Paramarasmius palmivorus TaxID=297713 RepID=A0AAW0DLP1_9AGAR
MHDVLRRSCQLFGVLTVLVFFFGGLSIRDTALFAVWYLPAGVIKSFEPVHGVEYNLETLPWDVEIPPHPNTTGHLIFNTAHSLLQNWPNTRYRNGHAVVPGTIPTGTLLYHGRHDSQYPDGSDWTSVDPEHSFLFCSHPCWLLTLVTTRPLNILYFDGSSAVKMRGGSMDTQDLLLWGEGRDDRAFSESERLAELCTWVVQKGLRLDGFVRMEMDFEVMLCDFSSAGGLKTVSFTRLANGAPPSANSPTFSAIDVEGTPEAYAKSEVKLRNFELVHSTSQHNHFPGETRVRLDLSRMITLYDTELAPSLITPRITATATDGRWGHRAAAPGMDFADAAAFRQRVEGEIRPGSSSRASGVDWSALMNVIVKRYGTRLETLRYLLETNPTEGGYEVLAKKAFTQLDVMLMPYITHPGNSTSRTSTTFELCATSHTSYTTSLVRGMTRSERMLLRAVRETTREICRVLVISWERGVAAGISPKYQTGGGDLDEEKLVNSWRSHVVGLMDWLDWSMWVRCRPACGDEEHCYLPTWPFFGGPPPADVYIPEHMKPTKEQEDVWMKPKPTCIRRIEPYAF